MRHGGRGIERAQDLSRDQSTQPRKLLVFIHVPKTGGMTVHEILRDTFGREYVRSRFNKQRAGDEFLTSDDVRQSLVPLLTNARAVSGHLFRPPIDVPNAQTLYATTLRHPFEWILSHYSHAKRRQWIPADTTLDDYLDHHYGMPNFQTRHFASSGLATDAIVVLESFLAVGVTDMTARFVGLLGLRLRSEMGVSLRLRHHRVNVAPGTRLNASDLTGRQVRTIVDNLGEDLKLYQYARHRFLKDWRACPLLTRVTTDVRNIARDALPSRA